MAAIHTTEEFDTWFDGLRDREAKARINVRIRRLSMGNPGQHRVLTGGVAEMKIDHGTGYRVYYTERADGTIVVLLVGGTKPTQQRDISLAKQLAKRV